MLLSLERQLEEAKEKSTLLQEKTPELEAAFDSWLVKQLYRLYNLT